MPEIDYKAVFARRFTELTAGWTADRWVRETPFSRNTLGNWRKGRTVPSIEAAGEVAKLFGVSLSWLVGESDERSISPRAASGGAPLRDDVKAGQELLQAAEELDEAREPRRSDAGRA